MREQREEQDLQWSSFDAGGPYVLVVVVPRADVPALHPDVPKRLASSLSRRAASLDAQGAAAVVVAGTALTRETHDQLLRLGMETRSLVIYDGPLGSRPEVEAQLSSTLASRESLLRASCSIRPVLRPPDVALVRLIDSIPHSLRARFVRRVLGPVLALPEGKAQMFLEVLEGLAAGRSGKNLASTLNLHRQTVSYRNRRITECTGFNPARARERLMLLFALLLWRVAQADLPPVGSAYWAAGDC